MLGIVILNYNNSALTIQCVESILKVNSAPCRFVLVDNASTDESAAVLRGFVEGKQQMQLVVSGENGGYARGNNLGLKVLENDPSVTEVAVLNNDIVFTEDIFPTMQAFLAAHPEAGLVSPLLRSRDGETVDYSCARRDCSLTEVFMSYLLYFTDICGILTRYSNRRHILKSDPALLQAPAVPIELPSGSCMMIRKDLFREIDWFDPNTFLYYEENILYRKLLAAGKTNYLLPSLSCIHLGGETTNKVSHPAAYMKRSKASGYYYVTHYRDLNVLQKAAFAAVKGWFNFMVDVVKFFKN